MGSGLTFRIPAAWPWTDRGSRLTLQIHWSVVPATLLWIGLNSARSVSLARSVSELLVIVLIVFMHEMGHALAARKAGIGVHRIVLYAAGGLVFLDREKSAAHMLWVWGAGPLVNLMLVPITCLFYWLYGRDGASASDIGGLPWAVMVGNLGLLIGNLLPVWPLDGGRLLQAWLSARMGVLESRAVSAVVGIMVGAAVTVVCYRYGMMLTAILVVLLMYLCVVVLRHVLACRAYGRYWGFRTGACCPRCRTPAFDGPTTQCHACGEWFNLLGTDGECGACKAVSDELVCSFCGMSSHRIQWTEQPDAAGEAARKPAGAKATAVSEF